ncbi:MAG: sigma-70 family RNA polymerase sigma factor [Clostridia bacterium]|nr:sigma-70 family RNA polymerase sigma factor [Clostridia bacterium]
MDNQQLPITAAAHGDQEAFRLIVRRMEPLIQSQIHACRCDGTEDEDLAQEALVGLLNAVRTYRPDGGAAFTTYATTCIRNRLLSAARRCQPRGVQEVPLEAEEELSDSTDDPALRLQEQEAAKRLLQLMRQRLTQLEYTVMLLRLSECSYEEIAARLGITKKAVDNAVQRLRRKIRQ